MKKLYVFFYLLLLGSFLLACKEDDVDPNDPINTANALAENTIELDGQKYNLTVSEGFFYENKSKGFICENQENDITVSLRSVSNNNEPLLEKGKTITFDKNSDIRSSINATSMNKVYTSESGSVKVNDDGVIVFVCTMKELDLNNPLNPNPRQVSVLGKIKSIDIVEIGSINFDGGEYKVMFVADVGCAFSNGVTSPGFGLDNLRIENNTTKWVVVQISALQNPLTQSPFVPLLIKGQSLAYDNYFSGNTTYPALQYVGKYIQLLINGKFYYNTSGTVASSSDGRTISLNLKVREGELDPNTLKMSPIGSEKTLSGTITCF